MVKLSGPIAVRCRGVNGAASGDRPHWCAERLRLPGADPGSHCASARIDQRWCHLAGRARRNRQGGAILYGHIQTGADDVNAAEFALANLSGPEPT